MREIKFRAWDLEKMSAPFPLGSILIGGWTSAVIMQYTGLHDQNGKEIYEGDVLRDIDWPSRRKDRDYVVMFGEHTFTEEGGSECSCSFERTAIGWFGKCQDPSWEDYPLSGDSFSAYAVVGNTYETPKLLRAAKHA